MLLALETEKSWETGKDASKILDLDNCNNIEGEYYWNRREADQIPSHNAVE
jgi:lysozyme family protein